MKKKILSVLLTLTLLAAMTIPIAGTWASEVVEEAPAQEIVKEAPKTEAPAKEVEPAAEEMPAKEVAPANEITEEPAVEEPVTEEPTEVAEEAEEPAETEEPEPTEVAEETEAPEEMPVPEETEAPEITELTAKLSDISLYEFAGHDVHATLTVEGGVAPYIIAVNGVESELLEAGAVLLTATTNEGGTLELNIVVTDAQGTSVEASCKIPIAVHDKGGAEAWIAKAENLKSKLTGDWHHDIVMIAKSQLGYEESKINFVVKDAEEDLQGYSVYGDWYGYPYEEWCAMFVSFCLKYAEIPERYFPRNSDCNDWIRDLKSLGVYEDDVDKYEPQPGDLIFFSWEGKNSDSHHVGIVEKVSGSKVYTIEGNSGKSVREGVYNRDEACIVGYANIDKLIARMEAIEAPADDSEDEAQDIAEEMPTDEAIMEEMPEVTDEEITEEMPVASEEAYAVVRTARVIVDRANIRTEPTTDDQVALVISCFPMDTEMEILGQRECDDGIWYEVKNDEITGWIRGDLVEVTEIAAEEPDERAQEIAAWAEEVNATEEMIERAMNAKSLDSVVLEGDLLIYVRTDEVLAVYDMESGAIIDVETGLVVDNLNELVSNDAADND